MAPARAYDYDAFVSYAKPDELFVVAFHSDLEVFAKPPFRRRAVRAFLDTQNLAASPDLWPVLDASIAKSRWFILMASPAATSRRGVEHELATWAALDPGFDRLIIVLLEGSVPWTGEVAVVPGDCPCPVPEVVLKGLGKRTPKFVDMRPFTGLPRSRRARHLEYLSGIADVSAPIQGKNKDEIFADYLRRRKRMRRAVTAVGAIVLLLLTLTWQAYMKARAVELAKDVVEGGELARSGRTAEGLQLLQRARTGNSALVSAADLLAARWQPGARLWRTPIAFPELRLAPPPGKPAVILIPGTNEVLATTRDGVGIWDLGSGTRRLRFAPGSGTYGFDVALSPGSRRAGVIANQVGSSKTRFWSWDLVTDTQVGGEIEEDLRFIAAGCTEGWLAWSPTRVVRLAAADGSVVWNHELPRSFELEVVLCDRAGLKVELTDARGARRHLDWEHGAASEIGEQAAGGSTETIALAVSDVAQRMCATRARPGAIVPPESETVAIHRAGGAGAPRELSLPPATSEMGFIQPGGDFYSATVLGQLTRTALEAEAPGTVPWMAGVFSPAAILETGGGGVIFARPPYRWPPFGQLHLMAIVEPGRPEIARFGPEGTLVPGWAGHAAAPAVLAFAPDGSRLLSADGGRFVFVWDVATGELLETLDAGHRVLDALFTSSSRAVLCVCMGPSSLIELESHERTPLGTVMAACRAGGDRIVLVRGTESGQAWLGWLEPASSSTAHDKVAFTQGLVMDMACDASGRRVAVLDGGGSVSGYDLMQERRLWTIGRSEVSNNSPESMDQIEQLLLSRQGLLLVHAQGLVDTIDFDSGTRLGSTRWVEAGRQIVSLSADGLTAVAASLHRDPVGSDAPTTSMVVERLGDDRPPIALPVRDLLPRQLAANDDGTAVAVADESGAIELIVTRSPFEIPTWVNDHAGWVVADSSDGRLAVAVRDGRALLLERPTLHPILDLGLDVPDGAGAWGAFSMDGRTVVALCPPPDFGEGLVYVAWRDGVRVAGDRAMLSPPLDVGIDEASGEAWLLTSDAIEWLDLQTKAIHRRRVPPPRGHWISMLTGGEHALARVGDDERVLVRLADDVEISRLTGLRASDTIFFDRELRRTLVLREESWLVTDVLPRLDLSHLAFEEGSETSHLMPFGLDYALKGAGASRLDVIDLASSETLGSIEGAFRSHDLRWTRDGSRIMATHHDGRTFWWEPRRAVELLRWGHRLKPSDAEAWVREVIATASEPTRTARPMTGSPTSASGDARAPRHDAESIGPLLRLNVGLDPWKIPAVESPAAGDDATLAAMIATAEIEAQPPRYVESIELLRSVLARDPARLDAKLMLGEKLLAGGNPVEALRVAKECRDALARSFGGWAAMGELRVRHVMARALAAQGRRLDALTYLSISNDLPMPEDIDLVVLECSVLCELGRYEEVRELCQDLQHRSGGFGSIATTARTWETLATTALGVLASTPIEPVVALTVAPPASPLRAGDVIESVGKTPSSGPEHILERLAWEQWRAAGHAAYAGSCTVRRDGQRLTVPLDASLTACQPWFVSGLRSRVPILTRPLPSGDAGGTGALAGDHVLTLDGTHFETATELADACSGAGSEAMVRLRVFRSQRDEGGCAILVEAASDGTGTRRSLVPGGETLLVTVPVPALADALNTAVLPSAFLAELLEALPEDDEVEIPGVLDAAPTLYIHEDGAGDVLRRIPRPASFTELNLSRWQPDHGAAEDLAKFVAVESLAVQAEALPTWVIRAMALLPRLHTLTLRVDGEDPEWLRGFSGAGMLRSLSLDLQDASPSFLREFDLPGLVTLTIDSPATSDDDVAALSRFPLLASLTLVGGQFHEAGLAGLAQCRQLRELTIDSWTIDPPAAAAFGRLEDLSALTLSGTVVDPGFAQVLPLMTSLAQLDLDDSVIDDTVIAAVGSLEKLERLSLLHVQGWPTDLRQLERLDALAELRISIDGPESAAAFRGARMSPITALPNLQRLTVDGVRLSQEDVALLRAIPKLARLNVSKGALSEADLAAFKADGIAVRTLGTDRPLMD